MNHKDKVREAIKAYEAARTKVQQLAKDQEEAIRNEEECEREACRVMMHVIPDKQALFSHKMYALEKQYDVAGVLRGTKLKVSPADCEVL